MGKTLLNPSYMFGQNLSINALEIFMHAEIGVCRDKDASEGR